jgi:hypothetical protein
VAKFHCKIMPGMRVLSAHVKLQLTRSCLHIRLCNVLQYFPSFKPCIDKPLPVDRDSDIMKSHLQVHSVCGYGPRSQSPASCKEDENAPDYLQLCACSFPVELEIAILAEWIWFTEIPPYLCAGRYAREKEYGSSVDPERLKLSDENVIECATSKARSTLQFRSLVFRQGYGNRGKPV